MPRKACIFSREFKVSVIRRMLAGENVRDRAGAAVPLEGPVCLAGAVPGGRGLRLCAGGGGRRRGWRRRRHRQRRIWQSPSGGSLNWSARSGSSWSSIFFSEPCGESVGGASRATGLAPRRLRAHRSDDDTAAARRIAGRAPVRAGQGEPRRLLPPLAGSRAAREETAICDAIQRLTLAHRHYSYRRIAAQLRRDGCCG